MKEVIIGTSFIWLIIIGSAMAEKLSEIITMDMIMNAMYIFLAISVAILAILKIKESSINKQTKNR